MYGWVIGSEFAGLLAVSRKNIAEEVIEERSPFEVLVIFMLATPVVCGDYHLTGKVYF